jgi:hypothetical protein
MLAVKQPQEGTEETVMRFVEERIRLLSIVGILEPLSAEELERFNGRFSICTLSSIG